MMNSQLPSDAPQRADPQSFRGRSLAASLTVNDLEKSTAWYQDVLGFTVDKRHDRDGKLIAVSLIAGTVRLLLTQDDGARGDRTKGEGFSLRITTAQSVDDVARRIKERGGTLDLEPTDMHGARVLRVHDPDGFKFAISSEPKP
jgi:catechol 2,3-dioxygenase-like lactoylglutathione lyase family enzyme